MRTAVVESRVASDAGRFGSLDTVRGLACLLLVVFHVVGSGSDSGIEVADGSALRSIMDVLGFVRMPIFTALSGYLFALRPPGRADFATFTRKKARRILIPLAVATTVFGLLRLAFYHEPFELAAFLVSYQHLWFLQALMLLFLVYGSWAAFGSPGRSQLILSALGAALLARSVPWVEAFSLGGAFYLAPYFVFGVLLRQVPALMTSTEANVLATGILLLVLSTKAFGTVGFVSDLPATSLFGVICGCAAVLVLLQHMPVVPSLASIGAFSYTIYLWHPLFGSAMRQALGVIGHPTDLVAFTGSLFAALAGPIALHRIAVRLPGISVAVTGLTARRRPAATTRAAGLV